MDKTGYTLGMSEKFKLGNRKIEKSAEGWQKIMEGKDGLGAFTDRAYKKIEEASEQDWRDSFAAKSKESRGFRLVVSDRQTALTNIESTAELFFPDLRCFNEQFPASWLVRTQDHLTVSVPPNMSRMMLGTGVLLREMLYKFMPNKVEETSEDGYFTSAMDLGSRARVTIDNVQTMLDVEALLTRFAKTAEELAALFPRLLQKCPNDVVTIRDRPLRVNPRDYTYLELFALAPFGFWASSVRGRQQCTYNGAPIVRPLDAERPIDPGYVYMITREKADTANDREKRHGGCPALHPAFREYDLINRLGKLFVKAQQEFLAHDKK